MCINLEFKDKGYIYINNKMLLEVIENLVWVCRDVFLYVFSFCFLIYDDYIY